MYKSQEKCSLLAIFFSSLTNPCTRFVNSVVYALVALTGGLAALGGGIDVYKRQNKATPLSETDFANVFNPAAPQVRADICVGDSVRILTGLFENFTGRVTEIDEGAKRIKVVVPMLKRETDVELAYDAVSYTHLSNSFIVFLMRRICSAWIWMSVAWPFAPPSG